MLCLIFSEAGVQNFNPRKRKKQEFKMGHGGTLDSAASGVLGKPLPWVLHMLWTNTGCYRSKCETLSDNWSHISLFMYCANGWLQT